MNLANVTQPVAINDLGGLLPGHPSVPTIWRWVTKGLLGQCGERVQLDTIRVGGRRFVEKEAIDRFFAALQPQPSPAKAKAARDSEAASRSASANAALEKLGC